MAHLPRLIEKDSLAITATLSFSLKLQTDEVVLEIASVVVALEIILRATFLQGQT